MAKAKKAWAIVSKRGVIDVETVGRIKRDVFQSLTIFEEETDCKIRRVYISLTPPGQCSN